MQKTMYISPKATEIRLHELMQVTVISGVADEDSMGRRLETDVDFGSWDIEMPNASAPWAE